MCVNPVLVYAKAACDLRGIRKSVVKEDNASLQGMLRVVAHIVKVEAVK